LGNLQPAEANQRRSTIHIWDQVLPDDSAYAPRHAACVIIH